MPREIKIVMIGFPAVGKTSLLKKYKTNQFSEVATNTVGVDYFSESFISESTSQEIILHFWDTAGQERFRSIAKNYYRGSDIVLVTVSAVTPAEKSIDQIQKVLEEYYKVGAATVVLVLVNKIDLVDKELLLQDWTDNVQGYRRLQDKFKIKPLFMVSAKNCKQEDLRLRIHQECENLLYSEQKQEPNPYPVLKGISSQISASEHPPSPRSSRIHLKSDPIKKKSTCCK